MLAAGLLVAGCSMTPMKPSTGGHVQTAAPAPAGDIPEPVLTTPILPKPKPAAKPETYSVVVNNVKVQELLFALARDAKLNVDIPVSYTHLTLPMMPECMSTLSLASRASANNNSCTLTLLTTTL